MQDHFLGRLFTHAFMPFAVLIVLGSIICLAIWAFIKWADSKLIESYSN